VDITEALNCKSLSLSGGQLLQLCQIPVENIGVPAVTVRSRILPDGLEGPSARNRSGRAIISRQDQGTSGVECGAVSSALRPPVIGAVYHRVAPSLAVVLIDKALDPRYHSGLAQAVACRA
jgi:hypothetical protein